MPRTIIAIQQEQPIGSTELTGLRITADANNERFYCFLLKYSCKLHKHTNKKSYQIIQNWYWHNGNEVEYTKNLLLKKVL